MLSCLGSSFYSVLKLEGWSQSSVSWPKQVNKHNKSVLNLVIFVPTTVQSLE